MYNTSRALALMLIWWMLGTATALAQYVQGVVKDKETDDILPMVHVYYKDDKRSVVQTDLEGRYRIRFRKGTLVFSMAGFTPQEIKVDKAQRLNVTLRETQSALQEVKVSAKRKKYSRKENPAVTMMRKVIAAKTRNDLRSHDYLTYDKYEKMVFSLNEFTPDVFKDDKFKRMPFLKDHVEVCPETGKLILPVTVNEKITQTLYRRDPREEKTVLKAERSEGLNNLINTGEIITTMLKDCFTDVDIYEDQVRLLQYPFTSPISTPDAIRFYRYFIIDTLMVGNDKCYQLDFTPNNPQDFGFSGSLFVRADSSWRVRKVQIGIPSRSDVNFVEQMDIVQEFDSLATGEQVVTANKMIVQIKMSSGIQKLQVVLDTHCSGYSFAPIPDKLFRSRNDNLVDQSAYMQDKQYWEQMRPLPLSSSEGSMGDMLRKIQNMRGFKPFMWVLKAFVENFVETSIDPEHPSKVDIGPVNTMIGSNWVEGLRFRVGAQTTANLNPHWFLKGYAKYGCGDERWKGVGELTYCFKPRAYLPHEYPLNNLSFSYSNDVMSPSDKFLALDKDNVFVAYKWTSVRHMNYFERFNLRYDREWGDGMRANIQFRREWNEGAGDLFYRPLDGASFPSDDLSQGIHRLTFTELTAGFKYEPGATYVNTKQRRLPTNLDAPVYSITHTVGVKGLLGGDYNYNFTEAGVYKRFWLKSWGKLDCNLKGGIQWNKVPFPFLIMPAANLSYLIDVESFRLIRNMEFLNDRYASAIILWDLNGKLLNRIPLIRRLKWRETIGCNVLWGTLTNKNNPFLMQNRYDDRLFYFPGSFREDGSFVYNSHVMDPGKPYVELSVGLHNIFKFIQLEYIHRINYIYPGTQRWGIRGGLLFSF